MSYESLRVNPDGAGEKKVTLTLANSTENTFYHKHAPRRGETPKKIHAAHADAARGVVGQIRDAVTN